MMAELVYGEGENSKWPLLGIVSTFCGRGKCKLQTAVVLAFLIMCLVSLPGVDHFIYYLSYARPRWLPLVTLDTHEKNWSTKQDFQKNIYVQVERFGQLIANRGKWNWKLAQNKKTPSK